MRYFIYLLAVTNLLLCPAAVSEAKSNSASGFQIVAIVNAEPITAADVAARTKLFLSTSGAQANKDMRNQVLQALISERIQVQAARSKRIEISTSAIEEAVEKLAQSNNVTAAQMKTMLTSKGVPLRTLYDLVEAQLAWIEYIRLLPGSNVQISEAEIENVLHKAKERSGGLQYSYVEIYLQVDKPEQEAEIRRQANEIAAQLRGGAAPKSIAQQFSQSASAQNGGVLTLIPEGRLDPALARAFKTAKTNDTIVARTAGGYTVAHLLEIQASGQGDPNDSQVGLYQVNFALTEQTPPEDAARIAAYIQEFQDIQGCTAFKQRAGELDGQVEEVSGKLRDLPSQMASQITKRGVGKTLQPVRTQEGISVFMTCSLKKSAFKMPTHDEVAQMLQEEKMTKQAQRERTRLQSVAYIEIKAPAPAHLQTVSKPKTAPAA